MAKLKQKLYIINSTDIPANWEGLIKSGVAYEGFDIEGTGHYPMVEKHPVFNMLLEKALKKISLYQPEQ